MPEPDDASPRTPWTIALVAVNGIAFVATAVASGELWDFDAERLVSFGAIDGQRVALGEWWRLLTGTFLHGGLLHLASNMISLWVLGRVVESALGSRLFPLVYAVAGLAGALASLAWNPTVTSVGASGAILGLFGAIVGLVLAARRRMGESAFRAQLLRMGQLLLLNVIVWMNIPNVDHAAHAGGLVAGFAATWLAIRGVRTRRPKRYLAIPVLALLAAVPLVHERLWRDPELGVHLWFGRAREALDARDWAGILEADEHLIELGHAQGVGVELRTFARQRTSGR